MSIKQSDDQSPRAVVFIDVDNTLAEGQSQFYFVRFLKRKGVIGNVRCITIMLWFAAYNIGLARNPKSIIAFALASIRGKDAVWLNRFIRLFFAEEEERRIFSEMKQIIQAHRASGERTVLLSNAILPLVLRFKACVGADDAIGTRLETKRGVFTGAVLGEPAYGFEKRELARSYADARHRSFAECFAYGDHESDLPLLQAVGHPVAVNPDREVRRYAREHSWPVLDFSLP